MGYVGGVSSCAVIGSGDFDGSQRNQSGILLNGGLRVIYVRSTAESDQNGFEMLGAKVYVAHVSSPKTPACQALRTTRGFQGGLLASALP